MNKITFYNITKVILLVAAAAIVAKTLVGRTFSERAEVNVPWRGPWDQITLACNKKDLNKLTSILELYKIPVRKDMVPFFKIQSASLNGTALQERNISKSAGIDTPDEVVCIGLRMRLSGKDLQGNEHRRLGDLRMLWLRYGEKWRLKNLISTLPFVETVIETKE